MRQKNQNPTSGNRKIIIDAGRLQPQAPELEQAILGALMLDKDAYQAISGILAPEMFYSSANEAVFRAIRTLSDKRRPVDMLTVVEALKEAGELEAAGGPAYISSLTLGVAGASHIEFHARIVSQKYLARKVILLTGEIQNRAFDETEDIADVIESLEAGLTELSLSRSHSEAIPMSEAVRNALEQAAKTQNDEQGGKSTAIPTGIGQLTRDFHGGWKAPDLIILAARPSMGKTQLVIHFAKSAAMAGKDVLFISIEMTATQLVNRLLLENDRISAYNLATGRMSAEEWEAVDARAAEIWDLKIHIADTPEARYLDAICSEARRLKRKGTLDMLVIDYLGLILVRNQQFERRQLEIARITGTLKSLAKELNIPVMLLSQLNRPAKGYEGNEPRLFDLRESGDIEQDADKVLFIHRPSYHDRENTEWRNKGKLIIGKNREGERNQFVKFFHDKNFKKIWGDGDAPAGFAQSAIHPDQHFEPQNDDENPF
jgi:replicative DNA helicase